METGHPSTRAVNLGRQLGCGLDGNRALMPANFRFTVLPFNRLTMECTCVHSFKFSAFVYCFYVLLFIVFFVLFSLLPCAY